MINKIHFLGKLPEQCYIALSGGPDSMAILDFLIRGGRKIEALYFNHGTEHGSKAEAFVRDYCDKAGVTIHVGNITSFRPKIPSGESPEEYWRNARYQFFKGFEDKKIIMGHNLDDEVENFLFTSIRNGKPSLIPYERKFGNAVIIRPFIVTKKDVLESWCNRKQVPYIVDPGNTDFKYTRSFIRSEMVPRALQVNPGLYKLINKKVKKEFELFSQA